MPDNVSKMKIVAYSDAQSKQEEGSMMVQVNPESYSQKIEIKYSEKQAQGTSGNLPSFSKIEPQKMDFELLFDRTGVINGATAGKMGVDEDIDKLQKLILEYQGDKHKPRYVSIYWGTLKFDGALVTMDISYKLFNNSGAPLRAVVKTTFLGVVEDKKRVAMENAQSPDVTHLVTAVAGDTLPLMCYRIYGDSKYCIEVAKANNILDFRNIKPGTKLIFPVIEG